MKKRIEFIFRFVRRSFYVMIYHSISIFPCVPLYQPIYGKDTRKKSTRDCEDRWEVIAPALDKEVGAVLDIGCNLGYFSFKASERGNMVLGIESDPIYFAFANAIKEVHNVKNCTFMNKLVDLEFLRRLPVFDVVFNFSVFHHWVKAYGPETSIEMMKVLATKTKRQLFFETGQSDEIGTKWYKKLAFMGEKPDKWIRQLLLDSGFKRVEMSGPFSTGLTDVCRHLFIASK